MANNFKYATIDVKGFMKDFHEQAKQWDDNYVRLVHFAVLNELRCRIGQQNWQKFFDDLKVRSVVVGSSNPSWKNEVR